MWVQLIAISARVYSWPATAFGRFGASAAALRAGVSTTSLHRDAAAIGPQGSGGGELLVPREPTRARVCSRRRARSAVSSPISTRPAEFLYDNMMIHATVVHAAHLYEVRRLAVSRKLLHLPAGMCPADQEEYPADRGHRRPPARLTRSRRSKPASSRARSCRRRHGCDFISAMPTNPVDGPSRQHFDLNSSHVVLLSSGSSTRRNWPGSGHRGSACVGNRNASSCSSLHVD